MSDWWRCPNVPPCPHPGTVHDVWDLDDETPMCCVDGCRCGQPAGTVPVTRGALTAGVPCAACLADTPPPRLSGVLAGCDEDGQVWPCGHTAGQVEAERQAVLALGVGLPVGSPIQRRPAPRDPT